MDKMNKAINVVFEAYKRHLEARLRILDEIIDAQIDEFQNMGMKFGEGLELSMKVLYPDREKMAGYAIQTAFEQPEESIDIFRSSLDGEEFTDEEREKIGEEALRLVRNFKSGFILQHLEERVSNLRRRLEQG